MMVVPFADWDETRAESAPAVGPWHRPQVQEQTSGPEVLVCSTCGEDWPCSYNQGPGKESR